MEGLKRSHRKFHINNHWKEIISDGIKKEREIIKMLLIKFHPQLIDILRVVNGYKTPTGITTILIQGVRLKILNEQEKNIVTSSLTTFVVPLVGFRQFWIHFWVQVTWDFCWYQEVWWKVCDISPPGVKCYILSSQKSNKTITLESSTLSNQHVSYQCYTQKLIHSYYY